MAKTGKPTPAAATEATASRVRTRGKPPETEQQLATSLRAAKERMADELRAANAAARLPRRSPLTMTEARAGDGKAAFLAALSHGWSVSKAARHARVHRNTVYEWRHKDEAFAKAWDDAAVDGTCMLEDIAMQRAIVGTRKPILHEGRVVAHVREVDNHLLFKLLAGRDPRYSTKRHEHSGPGGAPIEVAKPVASNKGLTREQAFEILAKGLNADPAAAAAATESPPAAASTVSPIVPATAQPPARSARGDPGGRVRKPVHSPQPARAVPKPDGKATGVPRRPKA